MAKEGHNLEGAVLAGRYKIRSQIGKGAMGTVYDARHAVLGRRLAVKVLHHSCSKASVRERFFHEARAAASISHEHIVQVLDFGLLDGRRAEPYIVMEYLDGETLDQFIQRSAPLDPDDAVEIAIQVLSALAAVHGAGVVHRDVKPANIMLARGRRQKLFVKLVDFGIARALKAEWRRPDLTRVDQVLGTPAYLSPEQAQGGAADPLWDLWAMGTILYEMLSGELPFRLQSIEQVSRDIASCNLIPLHERQPALAPWLLGVVQRAQRQRPEERYPSAMAFMQALEQRRPDVSGDQSMTMPFMRVDPLTPPPELIGRLIGKPMPSTGEDEAPNASPAPADSPRGDPWASSPRRAPPAPPPPASVAGELEAKEHPPTRRINVDDPPTEVWASALGPRPGRGARHSPEPAAHLPHDHYEPTPRFHREAPPPQQLPPQQLPPPPRAHRHEPPGASHHHYGGAGAHPQSYGGEPVSTENDATIAVRRLSAEDLEIDHGHELEHHEHHEHPHDRHEHPHDYGHEGAHVRSSEVPLRSHTVNVRPTRRSSGVWRLWMLLFAAMLLVGAAGLIVYMMVAP
ncbi:MAG: serine/threonine protein kinase [Myxococcales bacterium]|nr:serine/threonine protein kinase [Myxococcales bacterium]